MIKLYSTPTCDNCKKTKDYLNSIHARYVDIDISKDRVKRNEMIEVSGQQRVPVLDINGEIVIGFDKPSIINKLDKQKSLNH